jgi:hypothetical protein
MLGISISAGRKIWRVRDREKLTNTEKCFRHLVTIKGHYLNNPQSHSTCKQRATVTLPMFLLHLFLSSVYVSDTNCQLGPQFGINNIRLSRFSITDPKSSMMTFPSKMGPSIKVFVSMQPPLLSKPLTTHFPPTIELCKLLDIRKHTQFKYSELHLQ